MANFGQLKAEIGWRVWGTPANFKGFRVLARSLLQRRRSPEANQTALCLAVFWAGTVHFRGLLPLAEFCQVQNSLCIQVVRSPILAALLHGTLAAEISQTLRRGTVNGNTELSQRAPASLYGRAAITLAIGPHSSFLSGLPQVNLVRVCFWATVCKTVHPILSDRCLSV